MLKQFWKEQEMPIKLSGFVAALGALFLNISPPQNQTAKLALANIQVFLLVVLTVSLTWLFVNFIKLLIKTEKEIQGKYDIPTIGVFSITLALVFLWTLLNFWSYILALYPSSFVQFLTMTFPGIVLILCFLLLIAIEKYKHKFTLLSKIIVDSFVLAVLGCMVGVYIQQGILKYFYHYWLFPVFPSLFLIFFILFCTIAIYKKKKLLN